MKASIKDTVKSILKVFLIRTLKLANWQVFLILKIFDFIYLIFIGPFIKEEKKRIKLKRVIKAREAYHKTKKKIKTFKEAKEAIRQQWKIRRENAL